MGRMASVSWFCVMMIGSILATLVAPQQPKYQHYHHQQQQQQQHHHDHHYYYYNQQQQQQQQQRQQKPVLPSHQWSQKYRRGQLMDPGYLTLPEVLQSVQKMGLLYEEQPLFSWTLETLDESQSFHHYCPEKVYLTLDTDRVPAEIVHRRCDFSKLPEDASCLTHDNSKFHFVCKDHFYYRKVKVTGTWMYQKVFSGCGCNPTVQLSRDEDVTPR